MPAPLLWLLRLVPLNPIVIRLVQGGSRRGRHGVLRSAYLALLIAVLTALLLPGQGQAIQYQQLAVKGAGAFEIVAYLQIALICILAPVFMAGAIAQESNPRTWEILLTTPLSSGQMVLGHLFGRLFFVLGLLAASLPLFAITQYFGGVPGRSILLSYAVAACAALLVGAVAITLAVNRLAGRRAVFAFYVSVVTYLAITIAADFALGSGSRVTWLTALNPFLALRALLNPAGYAGPDDVELSAMSSLARFWIGDPVGAWCAMSGGFSVLMVATSTLTVRSVGTSVGAIPLHRRMLGLGAVGSQSRPARYVWHNPIAWREAAARQATLPKIILRWTFIALGGLWGLALILYYHAGGMGHQSFRYALLATIWTQLAVITLIAINTSATAISREREDGTLDLLLTTPITPTAYLNGKLRGLISYLAPLLAVPMGTIVAAGLYSLANGFERAGGIVSKDLFGAAVIDVPVVLPESAFIVPLVTVPFIAFCVMIGLQWSLKSRGTIGSVVATVGAVGVLAGIAGMCGWLAGESVPIIGPALAAVTPVTAMLACVETAGAFQEQSIRSQGDLTFARIMLSVGALLTAGAYALIVYGIRTSMVSGFAKATRALAGTR